MAYSAVSTGVNTSGTSATDSGFAVSVGDTVVYETRIGGTTCSTVTDSLGNTYTKKVGRSNSSTDEHALFVSNITAGGSPTWTITPAASGSIRCRGYKFTGRDVIDPVGTDVVSAGGTDDAPSGSLTVTNTGSDVLICTDCNGAGDTFTPGAGYTVRSEVPAAPNTRIAGETVDAVTSGARTVNFSKVNAEEWNLVALALKAAAGGGGPTPHPPYRKQTAWGCF